MKTANVINAALALSVYSYFVESLRTKSACSKSMTYDLITLFLSIDSIAGNAVYWRADSNTKVISGYQMEALQ